MSAGGRWQARDTGGGGPTLKSGDYRWHCEYKIAGTYCDLADERTGLAAQRVSCARPFVPLALELRLLTSSNTASILEFPFSSYIIDQNSRHKHDSDVSFQVYVIGSSHFLTRSHHLPPPHSRANPAVACAPAPAARESIQPHSSCSLCSSAQAPHPRLSVK